MVYNREESFVGHIHRHPARIWAEHRATRDGRLVAVRMRILVDGGAYASSSTAVISNACSFAVGPYAVDNVLIDGLAVYTNNPPCGAMRGFGAVQTCFAAEAQMDKLAAALDIDPVELRLLNALEPGGTLATGQVVTGSLPTREVIRRAAALSIPEPEELPRDAIRLPGGAGNTTRGEGVRRGVGFAVGFKNICYSEGFDDFCAARVVLAEDGSAEVHCAAAEVGQGVSDVILQVARLELGTDDVTLASGLDRARRLGGLGLGFAHDLDGRRRGADARAARRSRNVSAQAAAPSTSSASTGTRARSRSTRRRARSPTGRRTSRSRSRPCASSSRWTSSSGSRASSGSERRRTSAKRSAARRSRDRSRAARPRASGWR